MNHGITPGVIIALAMVVVIIGGSYWLARRQQGQRQHPRARMPRRVAGSHRATPTVSLSAAEVKAETARLLAACAGWPQIVVALNPSNDAEVHAELQRIRGPHMFAPATAIKVIHHGCELALRSNGQASALSALRAARESMEKITRYGD